MKGYHIVHVMRRDVNAPTQLLNEHSQVAGRAIADLVTERASVSETLDEEIRDRLGRGRRFVCAAPVFSVLSTRFKILERWIMLTPEAQRCHRSRAFKASIKYLHFVIVARKNKHFAWVTGTDHD